MPTLKTVNIVSAGGTWDKIYGTGAGIRDLSFSSDPGTLGYAGIIAAKLKIPDIVIHPPVCAMKDSLDMNEDDRAAITSFTKRFGRSVIIHGTDTMTKTARFIAEFGHHESTVILTGALQPACMRDSDAELNLGGAIIAARALPAGVYISMHGQVFDWDKCAKDQVTGQFVPI
jgi:L-asparaginase